jgi:hypothetical protein
MGDCACSLRGRLSGCEGALASGIGALVCVQLRDPSCVRKIKASAGAADRVGEKLPRKAQKLPLVPAELFDLEEEAEALLMMKALVMALTCPKLSGPAHAVTA